MRFKKGVSGNPAGKPRGAKDKRTELRALLQPQAAALVDKAVGMALAGDATALRICIDRIIPPIRARDEAVEIGTFTGSLSERGSAVLRALAEGRVTPSEAATLMSAISSQAKLIETDDLQRRIEALEAGVNRVGA